MVKQMRKALGLARHGILIAMAALILTVGPPAKAQTEPNDRSLVVVRGKATGFRVGDILRVGQTLRLGQGEELELLSSRGRKVIYKGPYSGPVSARGQPEDRTRLQLIRDAIFGLDEGTRVLGGTRMAPRPPEPSGDTVDSLPEPVGPQGPSILIDLSEEDVWCAVDDLPLWLVRPKFGRAKATLSQTPDGESASLVWSFFSDAAAWPAAVPQEDGSRYMVRFDSGTQVAFTLRKVATTGEPAQDLVALAQSGCRTQVSRAIAATTR
ncbi:MAG: hypothetical protein ACFB6R_06745 [Alphaproteobacteria bacterium]